MKLEMLKEAIKATPGVGGAAWYALSLNEWVALCTVVYIVVHTAYLVRKWWKEEREWAARKGG